MADTPSIPSAKEVVRGMPDEIDELYEFLATVTKSEYGTVTIAREFLQALGSMPGFVPEEDLLVVRDDAGAIIAVEMIQHSDPYVDASVRGWVHPDRLDEGIGTALLDWGLTRAKERIELAPEGTQVVASSSLSDTHEPAISLVENSGFSMSRYFLEMRIDFADSPMVTEMPGGITLRNFEEADLEVLYDTVDQSFRDHFGYTERSREEGLARWRTFTQIPGWDNSLVWMAIDGEESVGANVCLGFHGDDRTTGYVASLGVRPEWRGRGLAKAMLTAAFAEFYDRGKKAAALHVDAESLTGATRLYESVGMQEVRRSRHYERQLRPGKDIRVS